MSKRMNEYMGQTVSDIFRGVYYNVALTISFFSKNNRHLSKSHQKDIFVFLG